MDEMPNIVLQGGSPDFVPDHLRVRYTANVDSTFKLFMGHRYEHFRPTQEKISVAGRELRVFRWDHRTYVAE
ncbi:DUF5988 family protein [Streptomyces sodiiphilus]